MDESASGEFCVASEGLESVEAATGVGKEENISGALVTAIYLTALTMGRKL